MADRLGKRVRGEGSFCEGKGRGENVGGIAVKQINRRVMPFRGGGKIGAAGGREAAACAQEMILGRQPTDNEKTCGGFEMREKAVDAREGRTRRKGDALCEFNPAETREGQGF